VTVDSPDSHCNKESPRSWLCGDSRVTRIWPVQDLTILCLIPSLKDDFETGNEDTIS